MEDILLLFVLSVSLRRQIYYLASLSGAKTNVDLKHLKTSPISNILQSFMQILGTVLHYKAPNLQLYGNLKFLASCRNIILFWPK